MENNKLLIGVQFTEADTQTKSKKKEYKHINIELYVVRDITLAQLIEGIHCGLKKMAKEENGYQDIYTRCSDILSKCRFDTYCASDGQKYYSKITFTSFNAAAIGRAFDEDERFAFSQADFEKPLCDLGFITSSRIIFDATGDFPPRGMLDTTHVIEAFNPEAKQRISFPEYNISTRQLYQFNREPVELIAPTDPPQKPNNSLFNLLLPSVISLGATVLVRLAMDSFGAGTGLTTILLSVGMAISAAILTVREWKRQGKAYEENLKDWRTRYETYINTMLAQIRSRQKKDAEQLDALYPDMLTLINKGSEGVYTLNDQIYSRVPQDPDFLTFRIGTSNEVESFFEIKGEDKDVIFSNAFFALERDLSGNDRIQLSLREELEGQQDGKENLCKLPYVVSRKYARLEKAPLLYSLKHKGCLGLVDPDVHNVMSKSYYFISRMIFELCYYHSPEALQFVVFFDREKDWDNIEKTINRYKFMPHFRGLFPDRSQFVFDKDSAHLVMNSLLGLMNARQNREEGSSTPHVVVIVFDEYGLKEHAFAEYLPKAPENGVAQTNPLGMSFVFAAKYKEYLPGYCDDVVDFSGKEMTLTPRQNVVERKVFHYDHWDGAADVTKFYLDYTRKTTHALRFFSSVYYAQIAQNGKVPSSVSMFESAGLVENALRESVCANWGIDGKRNFSGVTKSLQVPIGKTENGLAYLDLHERADGPHMLVAGTTGSGKTETVISYLLGLCLRYRPDEVNLLLVDMKGGGFTKRIGHLPHVVGAVTDVDGDENGTGAEYMLGRFLFAMKAEIKRRKLLLNKLHVDSIDSYIQACENIEAHITKKKLSGADAQLVRDTAKNDPLPHLILVVDEFTELKRFSNENSDIDFMGEITTIARVGRSLGLHIILISQNIEGAITDDIRVNSKARLCLKVATKQASKEMIGTELAASAYMPGNGRAYLLVGTGSKFEYFQSAYSGAGVEESIPIEITLANKIGAYSTFYRSDKDSLAARRKAVEMKAGNTRTQLDAICDTIVAVCKERELKAPHTVFSSPLSPCIAWDPKTDTVIDLSKGKGAAR